MIENLSDRESVIVKNIDNNRVLFEHNTNILREAASVTKVFYAATLARMMTKGKISENIFEITHEETEIEGTNVLKDLIERGGTLKLETSVLVGLMLKYSCNASTKLLFDHYFSGNKVVEKYFSEFGIHRSRLYNENGDWVNLWTLSELAKVMEDLYKNPKEYGNLGEIARKKLKDSRNIFYLFDQLGARVLGSKTGTTSNENNTQVNDIGILEVEGNRYLLGAMVNREKIYEAVPVIRGIGKNIYEELNHT